MKHMRILVAEDDPKMSAFLRRGLEELGYNVVISENGADALRRAMTKKLDLIILDSMLPVLDGPAILRRLRSDGIEIPVLMLTSLGRIADRVDGLDAGADDYLTKPFVFSELAARIRALGRRAAPRPSETTLAAAGIEMDLITRRVLREGRVVLLQPREFRLLEELLRDAGEFLTRSMLLARVWGYHFDPQTKIIETHMCRLRSKLNEGGLPDAIETARGVGYRLVI